MKRTFEDRSRMQRAREHEGEAYTSVGDERRRALIEAAYRLIAERGIGGLRIRDVAAEVGVNNATLHYYFPTKESLILGVVKMLGHLFVTTHESGTSGEEDTERKVGTPRERMQSYFTDLAYQLQATPERFVVMNELYLQASRDPAVAQALDGDVEWMHYLQEILREGMQAGEFHANLDVQHTAWAIIAFCKGVPLLSNMSKEDVDATVAQIERAFLAIALAK